ncbi:hypothetical protein EMIHUDRAFT_421422 [Emiliania huxleyi CCMP1516]|uniref:Uncharacterized protein n=2 Tax=Emiliania huxleyi TaxID=2903 RepID=A0A0D3JNV1_EMIH1|nr:hypothetical protein EMIHUDRAFT_421422 [Emiliania huxleyi CCMP1516]EOD25186.1 hypothetical protein EMIHUDRAFT_421422 [Emiliania huxleyi CCMP1516]|eukprot:XP_005777615.1 hypothetical protein EMIHUDRAFT_421422 [Emiliania huxleyi CCMP1516]
MERMLFLATGFWVGGAAAWAPIAGYLLAPHCRGRRGDASICAAAAEDGASAGARGRMDAAALQRRVVMAASEDEEDPAGVLVRPDDPSALMTERDRMRLAPVHTLKRKRRSRKIVRNEVVEEKFSPLVPGARLVCARQSVQETIISAYAGDKLEDKQGALQEQRHLVRRRRLRRRRSALQRLPQAARAAGDCERQVPRRLIAAVRAGRRCARVRNTRMRPSGAGGEPRPPECLLSSLCGRWSVLTVCGAACGFEVARTHWHDACGL